MTQTYTDDVIIDGSQDEVQLTVQGHSTQSNPLQEWQDSAGDTLARVTEEGYYQAGDMTLSTDEALIEAHRDETSPLAERGIHTLGRLAGILTTSIAWLVGELELVGTAAISSIQTAVRGRLTHSSTGDSSNAEMRAGDFEVVNQSGTSGTPVGTGIGVKAGISNQSNAYLSKASGVVAELTNGAGADIETAVGFEVAPPSNDATGTIDTLIGLDIANMDEGTENFAIRTGLGVVHIGDIMDLVQQLADPAGKAGVVQLYAKDDKLFAVAPDDTIYDLTQGGGSVAVMTGASDTVDGASGLVPQPLAGDEAKVLQGDGNWVTPVTPSEMQGATSSADGASGLVPQPLTGDQAKYLKGDGTWDAITVVGALDDLSDVDTTGASNGDVLAFDGTDWGPAAGSGGGPHTHTLSQITDAGTMAAQNSNLIYITGGALDGDIDITGDKLLIRSEGFHGFDNIVVSNLGYPQTFVNRGRGSLSLPTAVQNGDVIGTYLARAVDGTNLFISGGIESRASANWSTTTRDAYLNFLVSKGSDVAGHLAGRFEAGSAFVLFDKVATPSAESNRIKLYSDAGELKVVDSGGNITTLSSHNPQMVDPTGRPTSYVHAERNPFTGKRIEIDLYNMEQGLATELFQDLGHLVEIDWAENEARQVAESQLERQRWQELPADQRRALEPELHVARPEPQFLKTARGWRKRPQ